mgnify:CR=1 FL=1
MKIRTFLSCIILTAFYYMYPLGLFDIPASPPPSYKSDIIPLTNVFVEIPEEPYDTNIVSTIIDKLSVFPPKLIDRLIGKGEKMRLITGRLTDEPEYQHLRGKIPRGWEDTGCTWDDVPGVGGNPIVVRIDACGSNSEHSSVCLELHEVAHRIDEINVIKTSDSYNFRKIWINEAPILFKDNQYFIKNCNEYFAECYAMYLHSDDTRAELKDKAPLTYQFFTQDIYNPLPKPDLSVYRFGSGKICGGLYKNKTYTSYSDIVREAYFKSTDEIYIAFAVTNYGKSTEKPLKISLWVDGKLVFDCYKGPIEEGHICRIWNVKIGRLSPGVHTIIYEADSNYGVSEADENNNWAEYKIEVE